MLPFLCSDEMGEESEQMSGQPGLESGGVTHINKRCDSGVEGLLCDSRTPMSSELLTYQSWNDPRDDESQCLSYVN